MTLVDRLAKAVQDFSYATKTWLVKELPYRVKKTVRTIALPLAMAVGGVASCTEEKPESRRYEEGNSYVVLPAKTKILENYDDLTKITFDEDAIRLYFNPNSSFARDLTKGDIIVVGISPHTPDGLLVKMTDSLHYLGGEALRAKTEPATLEEAIEEGHLQGRLTFTETIQQPLRVGGTAETRTFPLKAELGGSGEFGIDLEQTELMEGVYIDGNVSLLLQANFSIDIRAFSVRRFSTGFGLQQTASLEGTIRYEGEINKTRTFNPLNISAKQFSIGDFPVVITPVFSIEPFVRADGRMDVRASVSEELAANFGIAYSREKGWEPSGDFFVDFNYGEPTFSGCGDAKVGVRPQVGLSLYSVLTPYSGFDLYLRAKAEARALSVSAGLEAFIGGKAGILGKTLLDSGNIALYTKEKPLWDSPFPCQEITGDEPTCTPNSYRRCENGNISQYDSCDNLERVIDCENGCERGARRCNDAPVGEGEGEGEGEVGSDLVFTRMIEIPVADAPHQTSILSMAWDNSRLWYLIKLYGQEGKNLCALNVGTEETERCFENVTRYLRGRPSIAFAGGQMYIQEQDFDLIRNGISRISLADGSSEVVYDWPEYHRPVFKHLTSFNNQLHGSVYVEREGLEFCSLLLPDRLTCSDARDTPEAYIVKFSDEEFIKIGGGNYEDLVRINGSYTLGESETFDRVREEGKCFGQAVSLARAGNFLYVGCNRNRILEYRRQ